MLKLCGFKKNLRIKVLGIMWNPDSLTALKAFIERLMFSMWAEIHVQQLQPGITKCTTNNYMHS